MEQPRQDRTHRIGARRYEQNQCHEHIQELEDADPHQSRNRINRSTHNHQRLGFGRSLEVGEFVFE